MPDKNKFVKTFNDWWKFGVTLVAICILILLAIDTRTKATGADVRINTVDSNIVKIDNNIDSLFREFREYVKYQKLEDSIRTRDILKLDNRYEEIEKYLREH